MLWLHCVGRSYDKLKPLSCGSPIPKVKWHFDHVALWWMLNYLNALQAIKSHALITGLARSGYKLKPLYLHYHCVSIPPSLAGWWLNWLPCIKFLHPLVTWSCKIRWQTKGITSPLPHCQWPPNLAGWWLLSI